MSEQKYIYRCPGMEPLTRDDEGWEFYAASRDVFILDYNPSKHQALPRRKPVTDAEYRAHHGMLAWPCECPEGYVVVDFRPTLHNDRILTADGGTVGGISSVVPRPILEKIEPEIEWVYDVLDEEARRRPSVQVRDGGGKWKKTILYGVYYCPDAETTQYVDCVGMLWDECRMDAAKREGWK